MSVAHILEATKTLSPAELEALEHSIRLRRIQMAARLGEAEELRLLKIINRPMPHAERYAVLTEKWQDEGVDEEERAELLSIVYEREGQNAERIEAVGRLSELRGVPFPSLWTQLMGETPRPIVPKN